MVCADAADSVEAAGLQPQWRFAGRSCGLYAGDQRASESHRVEISSGPGVHAAFGKQDRRDIGDVDGGHGLGRNELAGRVVRSGNRSEEHTSELQSHLNLVCRLLLEKKKKIR